MVSIPCTAQTGRISVLDANYATARTSATGVPSSGAFMIAGQTFGAGNYVVYRGLVYFDTTLVAPGSFSVAKLRVYPTFQYDGGESIPVYYDPTYATPSTPMLDTDYAFANYPTLCGTKASPIGMASWAEVTLTDLACVNVGGITGLCLRNARDVANDMTCNFGIWFDGPTDANPPTLELTGGLAVPPLVNNVNLLSMGLL